MNTYPLKKVLLAIIIIITLLTGVYYFLTDFYINSGDINVVSVDFDTSKIITIKKFDGIINSRGSDGETKLFLYDFNKKEGTALLAGDGEDADPCFSPDFKEIVFASNRNKDRFHIYKINSNGKNLKQITFSDSTIEHAPSYGKSKVVYKGKDYGHPILYFKKNDSENLASVWIYVENLGERLLVRDKDITHYSWSKEGKHIFTIKNLKSISVSDFDLKDPFSKESPKLLNTSAPLLKTSKIIKDIIPGDKENTFIAWHEDSLDLYEWDFQRANSARLMNSLKLPVGIKFISHGTDKNGNMLIGKSLETLESVNIYAHK